MKFTSVRIDQRTNALKLRGMTLDALQESITTELKGDPIQKFRKELPVMETLPPKLSNFGYDQL